MRISKENIVFTDNGYVNIDKLSVVDSVLTNDNTFEKVSKIEIIPNVQTLIVHAMGVDFIKCTPSQRFLVRKNIKRISGKSKIDVDGRPSGRRVFGEPEYVCAKDLTSKHYLGIQILSSEEAKVFETDNLDFWWLCGTYVGDGCLDSKRRVIITCNDRDIMRLEPALKRLGYDYKIHNKQYERNCFNVSIKNDDFGEFVDDVFGHYSYAKNIPYSVINLPHDQLKAFYTGFLESDGCTLETNTNISQFTTVNRFLNCATGLIINKLFERPVRLYYQIRPDTYIIEGRVVNQRNSYQLRFLKEKQKFEHAFIENGYIWFPFSKLETGDVEDVYRIKLESGNGFVVGNCVVENAK